MWVQPDVVIEMLRWDEEGDPASDEFVKGWTEGLRADDASAKVVKTSFTIGKGVSYQLTDSNGVMTRGCVAPLGKILFVVRLKGARAAVQKAEADLKTLLNSLKKASS